MLDSQGAEFKEKFVTSQGASHFILVDRPHKPIKQIKNGVYYHELYLI